VEVLLKINVATMNLLTLTVGVTTTMMIRRSAMNNTPWFFRDRPGSKQN